MVGTLMLPQEGGPPVPQGSPLVLPQEGTGPVPQEGPPAGPQDGDSPLPREGPARWEPAPLFQEALASSEGPEKEAADLLDSASVFDEANDVTGEHLLQLICSV